MKRIPFTLIIIVSICLIGLLSTSCGDDDKENSITLSADKVELWVGESTSVSFTPQESKTYTLDFDDRNLVIATLTNSQIDIWGKSPGSGYLYIKDNIGSSAKVLLKIRTLSGTWRESENSINRFEIELDVANPTIKALILTELEAKLRSRLNYIYIFHTLNGTVSIVDFETETGQKNIPYTYQNFNLEFRYPFATYSEFHTIKPMGLRTICLTQDLVEEYKTKYPSAGVNKVEMVRYLEYISDLEI